MELALLLALFFLLMWGVTSTAVVRYRPEHPGTVLGLSFLVSATGVVFAAMLLAIVGVYSFWLLLGLIAVTAGVLWFLLYRKGVGFRTAFAVFTALRPGIPETLLILAALVMYLLFPTAYLDGGRDYGLYIANGVQISQTGSVAYDTDTYIDEHYDELEGFISLEYLGLSSAYVQGRSENPGQLDPQFFSFFPAALAIGYDVGGLPGLLHVNAVIAAMGLLAIGLFARRFLGGRVAGLLAMLFMAINPAQLWGARITQSEMLAQMLFIVSVHLLALGWQRANRDFWIAGAALIFINCFCRFDNYIMLGGLCALVCYCALWKPAYLRISALCAAIGGAGMGLSLLYGYFYHYEYIVRHWTESALALLVLACCGTLAAACVFGLLRVLILKGRELANPVEWICARRWPLAVLGALLGAVWLFGYFVRPVLAPEVSLAARSLIEYSWYMGFLTMPLAIAGCMIRLYAPEQKRSFAIQVEPLFYLIVVMMGSLVVYTIDPAIAQDHFWASRRWVPVNFPALHLFAAAAIARVCRIQRRGWKWVGRVGGCMTAAALTVYMGWQCRLFAFTSVLGDWEAQYQALAEDLPEDAPVFTEDSELASILRFVYGKQVYAIRQDANWADFGAYVQRNGPVCFIGGTRMPPVCVTVNSGPVHKLTSYYPARVCSAYPQTMELWERNGSILWLTDVEVSRSTVMNLMPYMKSETARWNAGALEATRAGGLFLQGPGCTLEDGVYRLSWTVEEVNQKPIKGYVMITAGFGEIFVDEVRFTRERNLLEFKLWEMNGNDGVEVTFWSETGVQLRCTAMRIVRVGDLERPMEWE